jgi:hypothetical protein
MRIDAEQGFMEIEIVEGRNLPSGNMPGGAPDTYVEVNPLLRGSCFVSALDC